MRIHVKEVPMDSDKLKKMLAGISIASLIAGVSIVVSCDGNGKSA
jgi:radical SAM modification target selenobiotic family peptide